ncbi:hypothetical protein TUMSATVNIG1_60020 (plasmid) [Vibrio nigripulchritudo]|nr:hypothetical protein VNTUMSATTG_59530 [Vibrio nigripulchritudo]BDU35393.1 hypothetical protein TUMSATVNIG1_60020 [Vibrio nigripulchritudo]
MSPEMETLYSIRTHAETVLSDLRTRASNVPQVLENSSLSQLKGLVSMLFELPADKYEKRDVFFKDLRYLPTPQFCEHFTELYAAGPLKNVDGLTQYELSGEISIPNNSLFT